MRQVGIFKTLLLVVLLMATMSFFALASDSVSLDQLAEQAQQEETVAPASQGTQSSGNDTSAIASIAGQAAMDKEDGQVKQIGNVMNSWGAKLMQLIGYVLSIGLGLMTGLDIVYIAIPPLRGVLANGYTGTADRQSAAQENGMMGGMNTMNGGIGSGYGRVGGGYSGIGGMNQMNANIGMQNVANNQPATGRVQLVTNAALNAVATASSGVNPFKIYFKQQLAVIICAPAIFVLAATGILARLGFMIGNAVSAWIGNISI